MLANSTDYQYIMKKIKEIQQQSKDVTRGIIGPSTLPCKTGASSAAGDKKHALDSNTIKCSLSPLKNAGGSSHYDEMCDDDAVFIGGSSILAYRKCLVPKIMAHYDDSLLLSSLNPKISDPNIAKLHAAGGYEPILTYTKAIVSAFSGLCVGLSSNREGI